MNRQILPESARISQIGSTSINLRTKNFEPGEQHQILLNFILDDAPYFFSSKFLSSRSTDSLEIEIPSVIYESERRDRSREKPLHEIQKWVSVEVGNGHLAQGEVIDYSPDGLGVAVPNDSIPDHEKSLIVHVSDGPSSQKTLSAEIRQRSPFSQRDGWTRLGLATSEFPRGGPIHDENRDRVINSSPAVRALQRWRVVSAGARLFAHRSIGRHRRQHDSASDIDVINYSNNDGEHICAIVQTTGSTIGAPVVVMPPAWGKTKETLMPVAESLISTFSAANEPLTVIRFDGIRKRGESYNDPACRDRHSDHHKFTFSQGVRDIAATIDFLWESPRFAPTTVIIVSFSASAIEARRAVAEDPRIRGWVSVVGASDLQSMMRVISGGIDYAAGLERGLRFGMQEVLGIEVDMDLAGIDAMNHSLVHLEDARRDMSKIDVPITWIHGRFDAWMDSERAKDALSRGNTTKRKFIEVPTGHVLRTSTEALDTFQLIACEVGRMVTGREIEPVLPNLVNLDARRRAERERLRKDHDDLRVFWKEYLVGSGDELGIDLMGSIGPYRQFMAEQVRLLGLREADTVLDLGSGTGSFPRFLTHAESNFPAFIIEADFVRAGLERTRAKLEGSGLNAQFVETNADIPPGGRALAIATSSVDAVLASLLVSYVESPERLLAELYRVLKPGGRLVISSLCRDADMSKLFMDGLAELRLGAARDLLGKDAEAVLDSAARNYLNQASKLLDHEDSGDFRFWDLPELKRLILNAGFTQVIESGGLGSPPQAVILSGIR